MAENQERTQLFKLRRKQKQTPLIVDAFSFKDVKIKEEWHSSRKNFKLKETLKNLFWVLIGAILTSVAFYYLITPANLYNNGLSAFAQLITKAMFLGKEGTPEFDQLRALYYYPIFFAMNVPLIIWGFLKLGLRFSLYTLIYMGINIGILTMFSLVPPLRDYHLLSAVAENNELALTFIFAAMAGLVFGAGLGLLFKAGGSSGGMDFISTYISMKRKYSIANIIKNTNIVIVVLVVFIDGVVLHKKNVIDTYFKDAYFFATIFYLYISAFTMNRVYPKYMMMTIFIISAEIEKVREYIYANNYLRGGNIWNVKGLYSGREYNMMMTTMSLIEYNFFKEKIADLDQKLFMIAVSTRDMYGGSAGNAPQKDPVSVDKITKKPKKGK